MADFVQTLPHELTTALSTLSLTGPALVNAVLFNRDLFLHITRFCELGALGALSATCKALEESVLDRQTWWHQCERLWPQPSLRSCRDPRGLCRRLKEGSTWAAPTLRSLDDLVLLIQIVKPDEEALNFEFNVGDLQPGDDNLRYTRNSYLLPGLPALNRTHIPGGRPRWDYKWKERVNVRLLRKGTFQVLGSDIDPHFGHVMLRRWQAQGFREFDAHLRRYGSEVELADYPVNVELTAVLEFKVDDGPPTHPQSESPSHGRWAVKLREFVLVARDTEIDDDPQATLPDWHELDDTTDPVPWPLETLNRILQTRWVPTEDL